jgi:ribonuclease Z
MHPVQLDALFLTHVHSDHVHDVPDLTMTRWLLSKHGDDAGPLPIIAPHGPTARFVRRVLGPYDDDIAARMAHVETTPPRFDLTAFPVPSGPERRAGCRASWRAVMWAVGAVTAQRRCL